MCGIGLSVTYYLASLTSDLIQALILSLGVITTISSTSIVTALIPHKIAEKN